MKANQAWSMSGGKNDETKAVILGQITRRQHSLRKTIMVGKAEGSRKRGRPNRRWIDSLKEATSLSLQEQSRVVEDRTFWKSLIHRVAVC